MEVSSRAPALVLLIVVFVGGALSGCAASVTTESLRAMASIDEWLGVVLDDFRGTPVDAADVKLIDFDPARLPEFAEVPDAASWAVPGAPSQHRLLLRVDQNVTSLDELAGSPLAAAVEIASYLQDFAMDALNRPWPQAADPDGGTTVLEPRLRSDGTPEWAGRGITCRFGELRALLGE